MIKDIRLLRYRGFERFRADLSPNAFLVGPNSAGKSTIIESLALAEKCLRVARRLAPNASVIDRGRHMRCYVLPAPQTEGVDPVHHDFADEEARVSITWSTGSQLHISWPRESSDEIAMAAFWLEGPDGSQPRKNDVSALYPASAVIPVITPLDEVEDLKNVDYVTTMAGSRLASRHFRNHMLLMSRNGELSDFLDFAGPWLPEFQIRDTVLDASANRLGVFYTERRSRIPKELAWAGDGLQIWLQLLWHIYRSRGAATMVLDEPEVYLHPDLQRRLVRILEDLGSQIILASHSSEIISEASPESVVWIDRTTTKARRISNPEGLSSLTKTLGTNYNLTLVRSSRSSVVLAAEMDDMRALRLLARAAGAPSIVSEHDITLVPLRSFSEWAATGPLIWIAKDVLDSASNFAVLLNSDSRPAAFNLGLTRDLTANGIYCHVWRWRELLNSLMMPSVLARASGADSNAMADRLDAFTEAAVIESRDRFLSQAARFPHISGAGGKAPAADFEEQWATDTGRQDLTSGQLLIEQLNGWLVPDGYRPLSLNSVARACKASELPVEVISTILDVEAMVKG